MSMTKEQAKWLTIRLEIIEEQAQQIRHLADKSGDKRLFPIVENLRSVIEDSCRKANLNK